MSFNLNYSEMVKVLMKLLVLLLSVVLYIHFAACIIYYVAKSEKKWCPPLSDTTSESFYHLPARSRYIMMIHTSTIMLTGNEIDPVGDMLIGIASALTIIGSLITANIFGTFAVVVTALNRKS